MWAIQFIDTARNETQASQMLAECARQDGYLAGRLLAPSYREPLWRVQALFEDNMQGATEWLPDGCRRVIVPRGFLGLNK